MKTYLWEETIRSAAKLASVHSGSSKLGTVSDISKATECKEDFRTHLDNAILPHTVRERTHSRLRMMVQNISMCNGMLTANNLTRKHQFRTKQDMKIP